MIKQILILTSKVTNPLFKLDTENCIFINLMSDAHIFYGKILKRWLSETIKTHGWNVKIKKWRKMAYF